MISRRDFITSASAAACAAAVPMTAQTASSKPRPNILILITDEQSADSTSGRIGSRYVHTPNMDGLADRGRIFTRAYCANPICVPSRNSMFTGRYPTEIGIVDNSNLTTASLDPKRFPMMGKIFEREGYNGGYFGKWHLACSEDETNVHGFRTMATTINDDTAAAAAAVQFLQAKHDAPFLLVASFLNPHNICEWARGQRLPLGAIGMPPPVSQCPPMLANHGAQINEPDIMTLVRRSYQDSPMFPVGNFDEKQWREYRWAYYRLVEKTDEQIGIVLQALRKSGLEQETLVVLLSDHGDCQGAHGWNQKTVFYDESARVPLVMSYPDVITPGVSTRLVNTGIDLIPTLCHYAGFTPPATLSSQTR
jgi:arylsulfatase A-like enzyme